MVHKFVILVVTLFSISTLLAFTSAEDVERRQIVAVRIEALPEIDGVLKDATWKKTQPSENFIQTYPTGGSL